MKMYVLIRTFVDPDILSKFVVILNKLFSAKEIKICFPNELTIHCQTRNKDVDLYGFPN